MIKILGKKYDVNTITLDLSYQQLDYIPKEINQLTNLQGLHLNHNQITKIQNLGNLINLRDIHLYNNPITKIQNLDNLTNLQYLSLSDSQITQIQNLDNLTNLQELVLCNNKITQIQNLDNLINLQNLYLNDNQIIKIQNLDKLTKLQLLYLSDNKITHLQNLDKLINLNQFYYDGNQIEYIPPNVQRFLDRLHNGQYVYNDTQSVHNHQIQESIRNSINKIISVKPTITKKQMLSQIMNDDILTNKTKELLLEYYNQTDVHSVLDITFGELLLYVWDRIIKSSHSNEIKQIMNTEMNDALCMCFTGRISRLVNSLNGFDPDVAIHIATNEQIGNIIILIKRKLDDIGEYNTEKHRELVKTELRERRYDETIINEWLGYI